MTFKLQSLPFPKNGLQPYISEETIEYHYGKHHQGYVNNLNKLIENTEFAHKTLEEIIKMAKGGIFNNAAQTWNHTFYWNCLIPKQPNPSQELVKLLEKHFGSLDKFKEEFSNVAATHFGSGWAWLVKDKNGSLEILSTPNGDNPITVGKIPLLTCDVWEHAYYIDYRNARAKYIEVFWNIVNWDFVANNLK